MEEQQNENAEMQFNLKMSYWMDLPIWSINKSFVLQTFVHLEW